MKPTHRASRIRGPTLEGTCIDPSASSELYGGIPEVLTVTELPILIGDDCAMAEVVEQPSAKEVGLMRIAGLAAARQRVEMAGRIVTGREQRDLLSDHRRSGFDQLIVVGAFKQVPAILVRLPRCVQDAGDEARDVGREECPEVPRLVQAIKRRGPGDRHLMALVAGSSVGLGVRGQPVCAGEPLPAAGARCSPPNP